jgi:hypothetical protein
MHQSEQNDRAQKIISAAGLGDEFLFLLFVSENHIEFRSEWSGATAGGSYPDFPWYVLHCLICTPDQKLTCPFPFFISLIFDFLCRFSNPEFLCFITLPAATVLATEDTPLRVTLSQQGAQIVPIGLMVIKLGATRLRENRKAKQCE